MRGRLLIVAVCAALIGVPAFSQDVRNTYIAAAAQVADGVLTNAKLANSSVTVAGKTVALGASTTVACADLSNGATGCSTATGVTAGTIPLVVAVNGIQTVSACTGTGANITSSRDYTIGPIRISSGVVTTGSTATTCTVNFATSSFSAVPSCTVSAQAGAHPNISVLSGALTLVTTSGTNNYDFICVGSP